MTTTSAEPQMSALERAREAAGLTVAEVASRLSRNTATIRRWEMRQHMPSRACLITLSALYGVPVPELVD